MTVSAPVGTRIRRAGAVAWALVGLAALVALLGLIGWVFRVVFAPLVLAGAIVFILNPAVTALTKRGIPRAISTGLTYVAVIGLLALAAVSIFPLAADQADQLAKDWPDITERTENWVDELSADSEGTFFEFSRAELSDALDGGETTFAQQLAQARRIGLLIFHFLLIMVLAPIIAFYLIVDLPHLTKVAASLVPEGARAEVDVVMRRLNRAIGGFFRGQLMVALIVGVMVSIGLAIIGLRFWFLIGMIAGVFNMIPLVGPWVGGVPGVVIALTTGDTLQAIGVVVVMVVAQQVDNHFITPQVMQRAVSLHPAAVILALLAGGTLGGFFGLLLAVPLAAALKILIGHLWRTHVLGQPLEVEVQVQAADDAGPKDGLVEDVLQPRPAGEVTAPPSGGKDGSDRRRPTAVGQSDAGALQDHGDDGA
ncbi:MAG TPA: AI-2E family transporter [Acidimicrobiales bacterium]|nr:AI-2E family transporter [Acidimicrobiales bacterium]